MTIELNTIALFAITLICVAVHFLVEPLRWTVYLRKSDKQSLFNLIYIFSSTAFFTYILPAKMGLPFRFWLISKFQKVKKSTTGIFMAVDSALSMGAWTLASVYFGGESAIRILLKNLSHIHDFVSWPIVIVGGLCAIILSILVWRKRLKIWECFKVASKELQIWQALIIILLFTIDLGSYVLRHKVILLMLPIDELPWLSVATISILSVFAGFVSTMPMGLVGYDATIIFLLNQQGVSLEIALLVPVINRAANIFVSLLMGVPSAYKLGIGIDIKKLKRKVGSVKNA